MSEKPGEYPKKDTGPAPKKKNIVATEVTPEPEQAPKYEIPIKECDIGKAGVGDLFNKVNEITRLLNDLLKHLNIKKTDLLKSN